MNKHPKGLGSLVYKIELEDLFAMQAMGGFVQTGYPIDSIDIAQWSYAIARAMISEKERLHEADTNSGGTTHDDSTGESSGHADGSTGGSD